MTIEIDFSDKHKYTVAISHDDLGDLGKGVLSFGASAGIYIQFQDFGAHAKFENLTARTRIKAKTDKGINFTLFDCEAFGFILYARFVVAGDVTDNFTSTEIQYSDISEWFLDDRQIKAKVGEEITWTNPVNHLDVTIKAAPDNFTLTSEYVASITKSGNDHLIHEHINFCFKSVDGSFRGPDIRRKSTELSTLLSILTAQPISVIGVQVKCEKGQWHSAYFATFKKVERDSSENDFPEKCFISKSAIHDRWQTIVENYYKSSYREISWLRLASMQRYDSFWEYKALGYVTLLDKYVDLYAKSKNAKPPIDSNNRRKKIVDGLRKLSSPLSRVQLKEIEALIDANVKKPRQLSFSEKFFFTITDTDSDVLQIIKLSEEDFSQIKDVRDAIAHGDALDSIGSGTERVGAIIGKITLLLTYWAFVDFGLTSTDFMKCLSTTRNRLRVASEINTVHLDRMNDTAAFYTASREQYDALKKISGIQTFSCFIQNSAGQLEFSEKYTTAYRLCREQHAATGSGALSAYETFFGIDKDRIEFPNRPVYIECEGQQIQLFMACIVKDT